MNKQVVVLSSLVIFASSHARSIYISSSINKFQEQTTGIIYETISEGFAMEFRRYFVGNAWYI